MLDVIFSFKYHRRGFMAKNMDCDVLIAGAGPTGMSAAIALHDAGLKVMIIDKHQSGLSFSRAILVNSQTLSLLKPFGIADKIMAIGHPFSSITINGPEGVIISGRVDVNNRSDVHPTSLPQLTTEKCFYEGLAERAIKIERPCSFKSFIQKEDYVESIIEKDEQYFTIKSSYLLGADGFHSSVREGLGFKYNQSARPLLMYSQDAVMDWSDRSDVNIWILDTGAVIGLKIGDNLVRFAATNKDSFSALGISSQIQETTWESEFDVYFAQVDSYGEGRVWLAGDAAHVHSPVGGRGMNMGIADGIRFAEALVKNDLAGYQADRHAVSSDWVRKNQLFTEIMTDRSIKGKLGRSLVRSIFRIANIIFGKNAAKKIFQAIAVG